MNGCRKNSVAIISLIIPAYVDVVSLIGGVKHVKLSSLSVACSRMGDRLT